MAIEHPGMHSVSGATVNIELGTGGPSTLAYDEHSRLFYPWEHDKDEGGTKDEVHRIWRRTMRQIRVAVKTWKFLDWASFFIPAIGWLQRYNWTTFLVGGHCTMQQAISSVQACNKWLPIISPLQYDLIAGISVGFMVIPQGLSYANSAGVPSVFGLYGAFLPCLIYSLLGTSRQLAVGPVAVTSLIIYANLQTALPCASGISNPNIITDPTLQACQAAYNQAAIQ